MKNSKKYLIIGIISLLLLIGIGLGLYFYLNSNELTISEKKWIDENQTKSTLLNVNVLNNANVFGDNGTGVFFDFIKDFSGKYDLNVNEVTYNYGVTNSGVTLGLKTTIDENDVVFYTDHYILAGKSFEIINNINDLTNKKIGIIGKDLSYVSRYINNDTITYVSYEDISSLLEKSEEYDYVLLPLHLYLEDILKAKLEIIYHFSDINMYYVLSTVDDTLSSVLEKYYLKWQENISKTYNENLFNLVVKNLGITDTEIDSMRSVTYKYGYINNSPYEVISGGNYGGIVAVYLDKFMNFADIEFNFTRYKSYQKFTKALAKNEIDVFFGYYNTNNGFSKTQNGINISYAVVANTQNDLVINSINSLSGKKVYVDKNSILYNYLKDIKGVDIKTYKNSRDLLKLNKKDVIIFIDNNIFEYYKTHGLDNYTSRYVNNINNIYNFNVKTSSAMYKLLNKYVDITDSHKILNEGIYNHDKTVKYGSILGIIAKYFIYFLAIFIVIVLLVIRKTKKITIAKKIKKDDKLKFIDQLTLLKNRNYLSENIHEWNNNTIYPQTIVVVDLNKVQEINDTKGYEEGDKQIKAASNALIKTQLDNSDIIRTDGNEFLIYLVGYSQKQVTNYIHKLNKEFKKLPYNYGAEFGYSIIDDDLKSIEDALNEATKSLKKQKDLHESKN